MYCAKNVRELGLIRYKNSNFSYENALHITNAL